MSRIYIQGFANPCPEIPWSYSHRPTVYPWFKSLGVLVESQNLELKASGSIIARA